MNFYNDLQGMLQLFLELNHLYSFLRHWNMK